MNSEVDASHRSRAARLLPLIAAALAFAAAALVSVAEAKVFYSKEGAMKLAFPGADRVKARHLFVSSAQAAKIERTLSGRLDSKLYTLHVGYRNGQVLGYAFIDTHAVRTLPETFMVVLNPRGKIRNVHILAFHEPQEYLPPQGWLRQFQGRRLSGGLRIRHQIAGLAGSTLSAHALTAGVRKILALFNVMVRPHALRRLALAR